MLAHAMRSTRPTAAIRMAEIIATSGRKSGGMRVWGITIIGRGTLGSARIPRFVSGYARASCRATPVSWVCASVKVTPRLMRATIAIPRLPRAFGEAGDGM